MDFHNLPFMIRCLAIDDEPLALEIVASFVEKTPFLELVDRCENALDAIDKINNGEIELIFLDIEMPDYSGFQLHQFFKTIDFKKSITFIKDFLTFYRFKNKS